MSVAAGLLGSLLLMGALALLVVAWWRLGPDVTDDRLASRGTLSQAAVWLRHEAQWHDPEPPTQAWAAGDSPPERALWAVLQATALRERCDVATARKRLAQRHDDPVVRAFLAGRMSKAARERARQMHSGPPRLFPLWFVAVAWIRHGPRGLRLDALSHALKELRT